MFEQNYISKVLQSVNLVTWETVFMWIIIGSIFLVLELAE